MQKFRTVILLLIIACVNHCLLSQDNSEIFDENKFKAYAKMLKSDGEEIILKQDHDPSQINEYGNNTITEKLFRNTKSGNEIYYTGAECRGGGIFWIDRNGKKTIILETYIRYGPRVIWHDRDTIEICLPTGSPFTHSYFYDFKNGALSDRYDFPVYYDADNKVLLIWGKEDFELYDIKNNQLIKQYNYRRQHQMTAAWPYINYYIEKENLMIILYYDDWMNRKQGKLAFNISGR